MDIKITRTCTQRIAINPGERLEDLKWRPCGKPATTFVVITMFGNNVKLQMCEEHKSFIIDMSKMTEKEALWRDAGVPEHVIHNTIRKEITHLISNK